MKDTVELTIYGNVHTWTVRVREWQAEEILTAFKDGKHIEFATEHNHGFGPDKVKYQFNPAMLVSILRRDEEPPF